MDLFDPTQNLLESALRGSAARQSALSNNLANANTPGYRRVDVDFHSALRAALDGAVPASASEDVSTQAEDVSFTPQVDQAAQMRLDGGTVDVDVEASNLAENGLEYEALASVARGRLNIIESAIGGR